MIYYKISFKITYKNIFKKFLYIIIDILLFFIKQNKKKKSLIKISKSIVKSFKNIFFFLHVKMFDLSLVEGYVFFLIYFYNDFYYKS